MAPRYIFFLLFICLFFSFGSLNQVRAATVYLTPAQATVPVGESFTLDLLIDTQGKDIFSVQTLLEFDLAEFEIISVESSGWFPEFFNNNIPLQDKFLHIFAMVDPLENESRNGNNAEIATITLRGKKVGMAGGLSFICQPGDVGEETRILDINGVDIVDCDAIRATRYSFTFTASVTPTTGVGGPTPTSPAAAVPSITGEPTCDLCGYCQGGEKPRNWQQCKDCITQEGRAWTVIGCIPTTGAGFIQAILRFIFPFIGGLGFLGILWGGFLILTSRGDYQQLKRGKLVVMGTIGAMLLILFAVFILRFVSHDILGLPGFK